MCGKLRACFPFWRDTIGATEFVLDIIQNGYKIPFKETPLPFSIDNRSSAKCREVFVCEAISELLERGCIRQVHKYPQFCSPLHVAVLSSGKLRLILDLSHINQFVVKTAIKYEDLRCVLQIFSCGMFVFCFDLKSAYHHVQICDEHTKFLSFKWPSEDGDLRFYEFKVLPFGLTSAPYVFTKVMHQLIKYWRGQGHQVLVFLDDGIGGHVSHCSAQLLSRNIRQDLIACGFTFSVFFSVFHCSTSIGHVERIFFGCAPWNGEYCEANPTYGAWFQSQLYGAIVPFWIQKMKAMVLLQRNPIHSRQSFSGGSLPSVSDQRSQFTFTCPVCCVQY